MNHERSWYENLINRNWCYTYIGYPYTSESLGRVQAIKGLSAAVRELIDEREELAAEIATLKERLGEG